MGISLLVTFRIFSVLFEKRLILSFSFPVTSLRNSQNSINDIKGYNGPYNRNAVGSTSYGFPFYYHCGPCWSEILSHSKSKYVAESLLRLCPKHNRTVWCPIGNVGFLHVLHCTTVLC